VLTMPWIVWWSRARACRNTA